MTPQARVQAAIEVLDLIVTAALGKGAPADRILSDWFRTRRFAGSKDRRAVRELVYRAIRACGEIPASGRAAMLRLVLDDPAIAALFTGEGHAPAPIEPDEPAASAGVAPLWLERRLADSDITGETAQALLARAPLDIRINGLKAERGHIELPVPGEPLLAPHALRLPPDTQVETWELYQQGQIEVQDHGSQLVCLAACAQPGETVVDLCAGAGGKTLGLAAAMANRGRLIACDVDRARLSRLAPRAARAGATIIAERLLDPGREADKLADLTGRADAVLIDAPCSGTGTWRRNPEARWRLSEAELARLTAIQMRLLDLAAPLVQRGGRLIYVTCSLLDAEGADQIAGFLTRHPDWRAVPLALGAGRPRGQGTRLDPHHDQTDGFFVARLEPM
ncbi:RsmB/NOP family class I SAM-dependent RNA methyltransferase [Novosphingobium sp. B 225]|uniref:RsmB/NOP family class I SAM-dependent RNA methyltransferase n=1 Tax=Novosphingobium sp. B 225 TaxID=1961849 RepID=UPI000B4B183B|nr:RsmB/NOP family class I SAM-dependent RNA methyltransferase [Novosphingobium sp. B 225]